jgi:hypothetical protein
MTVDEQLEVEGLCVDWLRAVELMREGRRMRRTSWGVMWSHLTIEGPSSVLVIHGYQGRGKFGRQAWAPSIHDTQAQDWQIV